MPSCSPALRAVVITLILLGSAFALPVSTLAQETSSTLDSGYLELPAPADAEAAVQQGAELERARRWIDAITHYEKAVEQFPENRQLTYGLRRSKIHFGIDRRYSDGSFEHSLLTKTQSDGLALFDEIYSQIRSNYVEPVSVTSFVAHGTESLYLALANDKFVERNIARASDGDIARLRQTLRDHYWNKNVEGSGNARATVLEVCRLCRSTVGLPETAVVMEYVFGGCNALDDYSNYLTPDRLDDLYGNIEGEFVGLGIEMQAETGRGMLLVNVLPESPAAAGGMRPGEHIVSINSVDCRGMTADEAAKLLRGPIGSTVELELLATSSDEPRRGRFVRRPVVVKSIDRVQMVEGEPDVGYIRMSGFQKTTAQELDAALAKLEAQGMKKLIWDLRDNPGGLLTAAVEVLDRFIPEGVLVSTKGRSLDQNWTYSAHRSGTHTNIEIVLLVNENSASASEIVAGAIRDHKRGVIVGRKTFGKWSVQSILPIRDKTGLRLTTAKFYSPADHNYAKIGVKPDVEVPLMDDVIAGYRGGDAMPVVPYGALDLRNPDIVAARKVFQNANQAVTSR
jgi:carboxyl-terminal processing protease